MPDGGRDAGAEGADVFEEAHIGRDPDVFEKERRGALAIAAGDGVEIDQRVDLVDELQVAVQQDAPDQHALAFGACHRGGGVDDHAAVFHGAVGGHGGLGLDQPNPGAVVEMVGKGGERAGGEDVDLAIGAARERGGDHRPARGGASSHVTGQVVEEIEVEPVAGAGEIGDQIALHRGEEGSTFGLAPERGGGAGHQPVEILLGNAQVAFDIGDQHLVVIGGPAGHAQKQQERHQHRERQQRQRE